MNAQSLPEWQNPDIVEVNRVDPHANLFPFETLKQALQNATNELLALFPPME
ncbi:MAG: hypothetical protein ACP5E3_14265 [Bacteroidales bacterium]